MNVVSPSAFAAAALSRAHDRPDLLLDFGDLPASMRAVRDLIAERAERVFSRGVPVRVMVSPGEPIRILPATHNNVTEWAHEVCRPTKFDKHGLIEATTLPDRVAKMYLDHGDWRLRPLDGVTSSPLLADDGSVRSAEGYDEKSRLWCQNIPHVPLPGNPSRADADAALRIIRAMFATFPFADAARITAYDADLVDPDQPPGDAESALIAGLMTAICRPSLWLAPGLLISAPDVSGAGSGKGLLTQAICQIAFGAPPATFTAGHAKEELDKRITSALVQAGPAILLDNANAMSLKSDILASVITERPTEARKFGETKMLPLNSTAWIAITGNGLSVSEDLARRFLACELDPKCDDPEARDFPDGRDGFLATIKARRGELLAAALTIWRWGRLNEATIAKGKPFGSFETWARWIRDPLLALGCADPVEAIARAKARDPRRLKLIELFEQWWADHHNYPIPAARLSEGVKGIIDPQNRGRNYIVATVNAYVGTRAAGFVLTRQDAEGRWGHATYALQKVES